MKLGTRTAALAAAISLCAAAPAAADTVAYIDGHNLWLASPDGAHKLQVTTDGTEQNAYSFPSQGHDGKTVVAHRTSFDDGSKRPTLHLFGPDAKLKTANVMPVYSGATIPVYPIGLDMDWTSNAVAYGYSYCGFACNTTHRGYWLTFSDNQGLHPTNPQGQSDAYFPTFYGKRVVSSDSGGSIFVQPDVEEAPFTSSYESWLTSEASYLTRAEVAKVGNMFAVEWSERGDGSGEGIVVGRHQGTIPSDVGQLCDLPVAANSANVTFSPDGRHIAWNDDEGVKVAGVPNLTDAGGTCQLSAPVKVISATGGAPSFGGGDVGALLSPPQAGGEQPGGEQPGGEQPGGEQPGGEQPGDGRGPGRVAVAVPARASTKAFARGLKLAVEVPAAGRVSLSATVTARVARRARLRAKASGASAALAGAHGVAAARGVVVARGIATAGAAGTVTVKLKPTAAARRAAKRLRGAMLKVRVAQGAATSTAKIRLR